MGVRPLASADGGAALRKSGMRPGKLAVSLLPRVCAGDEVLKGTGAETPVEPLEGGSRSAEAATLKLEDMRKTLDEASDDIAASDDITASDAATLMTGAAVLGNEMMTESQDIFERRSELEHLDALKHRIRASSYSMFGQDWDAIFRKFDKDGSGELDMDEFCAALRGHAEAASLHDDDLVDLFMRMDTDDSGTICADEFRDFMAITPDERLRKKARDANGQGTQECEWDVPPSVQYATVTRSSSAGLTHGRMLLQTSS